jgi:hypothetical protein
MSRPAGESHRLEELLRAPLRLIVWRVVDLPGYYSAS